MMFSLILNVLCLPDGGSYLVLKVFILAYKNARLDIKIVYY